MLVDAGGSGGVTGLDQIMYDDAAYNKALLLHEGGIELFGYESRDDLGALDMAPEGAPCTADPRDPAVECAVLGSIGTAAVVHMDDFRVDHTGDGGSIRVGEDLGGLGTGGIGEIGVRISRETANVETPMTTTTPLRGNTGAPPVMSAARVRVTTHGPTTRVLGGYDRPALAVMTTRELRKHFCDVFDAPPPLGKRDDCIWLRGALAPHAVDQSIDQSIEQPSAIDQSIDPLSLPPNVPSGEHLVGPIESGWGTDQGMAGFHTESFRFECAADRHGPVDNNATDDENSDSDEPADEDARLNARTKTTGRDFGDFERGGASTLKTPSPVDRGRGVGDSDLDWDGLGADPVSIGPFPNPETVFLYKTDTFFYLSQMDGAGPGALGGGHTDFTIGLTNGLADGWRVNSGWRARGGPNAGENLDRVAQRTLDSTSGGWASVTAAAVRALETASGKVRLAVNARAECAALAAEAGKAVRRARRAAANAARCRDGTARPVPFTQIPNAIARRLRETGACAKDKVCGRTTRRWKDTFAGQRSAKNAGVAPRSAKKAKHAFDSRDRPTVSRSVSLAGDDAGSDFGSERAAPALAEPTPTPVVRPEIINLVKGDETEAQRVAQIWQAALHPDNCHVCGDSDSRRWSRDDKIVSCHGCDVKVHLSCYGLQTPPSDGTWLCQGCEDGVAPGDAKKGDVGTCALCPQPGGALAVLDPPSKWDVAWETPGTHAHVSCASCLPEVFVWKDLVGRELKGALVDMSFVKASRINLTCTLCGLEGACTQCAMKKCFHSFHPLCARGAGFATERHEGQDGRHLWFCSTHSGERWGDARLDAAGKGDGGGDVSLKKKAKTGGSTRKAKTSRKGKAVEAGAVPVVAALSVVSAVCVVVKPLEEVEVAEGAVGEALREEAQAVEA